MEIKVVDKIKAADLYDFYGELLNDHQRKILEDYLINDLSLAEIAEDEGISRQGVHDLIRRCTKTLESYEDKLHLLLKFKEIKEKAEKVTSLTEELLSKVPEKEELSEIKRITSEIVDSL
ncbi:MAG: DNA-binding protein [Lachnospiraceae bacterium]|nr:DNA-binding protein [Lachnospiraceae bacterium]